MRQLALWALSRAELLVYVSAATRAEVEEAMPGLAASRSVVAWNGASTGVDLAVQQKCDDGVVRVLSVSRLVKRKNIPFAVSAVAELYRRLQGKVVFTVTGTGPELSKIEAAVEREQLPVDVVRLVGRVDEARLSTLYREADIFFHPQCSRHDRGDIEGFGISIIDAMAYGVPVVCGRDGGPSEYVESGVNGYLVKGDDLGEAVSLLEGLALNPALRSKIANEARNLVTREMTWVGHVRKIVESISP
jgi:glycosyltransferase involved in cell wall biosynthesis